MSANSYALASFVDHTTHRSALCHTEKYAASRIVTVGSNNLELQDLALSIFELCSCKDIDLKVIWIPREINIAADNFQNMLTSMSGNFIQISLHFSVDNGAPLPWISLQIMKIQSSTDSIQNTLVQIQKHVIPSHRTGKTKTIYSCHR